jgi:asparagine synthase (glutamine-hydrolysing)
MCGIAGFTQPDGEARHVMGRMLERISHRGPDDRGQYVDSGMALGNVLLSLIDIGNGHQPMRVRWRDKEFVGVYNGEIYNHKRLRDELRGLGMSFQTNCDTEVMLAALACWGKEAIKRFEGQWAMAVWCPADGELILARDPLGIKPLFFYEQGSFLAFASEPKALFAHPGVPKRPNPEAIQDYFLHGYAFAAGYSLNHRSFYEGIRSLPPGTLGVWKRGQSLAVEPYFSYPVGGRREISDPAEIHRCLGDAVRSSIEDCMMGEAPLGIALSGGLDSSIIGAVAAKKRKREGLPPLLASCIRYKGQAKNEDADHAALLKDYLGDAGPIDLVYSELDASGYLADVDELVRHFDEPHWEPKQLAMFNNYRKLKREGAKMVMTGEGADEMFFGYYHKFPGFLNPSIGSMEAFRHEWSNRLPHVAALFARGSFGLRERMEEALQAHYAPFAPPGLEPARAMQCWYLATFLHWLLIDNDRCSMAFSLEGRFPFLNRRVFEVALSIPPGLQLGGSHGEEKMCLRQAFRDDLPEAIWRHRKKAPLPSPEALDFHAGLVSACRQALLQSPKDIWEVLNRRGAEDLVNAFEFRTRLLATTGNGEMAGLDLTRYLHMNQPWEVRTPQVFGLLTLLRWWTLNFQ